MVKLLVAIVCCVVAAMPAIRAQSRYPTKYDNMNIDEILKNDRLVLNYFNCLMETGKCTPEAEILKKTLPDAIENNCTKCSDKQKSGAEKIMKYLYENKNDLYKQLEAKYDPQGIYRQRYQVEVKKLTTGA